MVNAICGEMERTCSNWPQIQNININMSLINKRSTVAGSNIKKGIYFISETEGINI